MHKLFVVAKNELKRYFLSPLAYVYLISFVMLNGSFALYFGHFFERGQADLLPMFVYQPWLYLLFIPGISMRLWAEEFRSKTIVQLVTMPVSTAELVWGKFLASWLFCAAALVLTFPFWITVNVLGNPDNAVIAAGYAASWVLAGCMLAVSQTMSALTKNQVIALVLAVGANLLFFLSGLEYVLAFFRLFAPEAVIDMIASFSFLTHFETMSRGLVELRDAVFFGSLILLFNFTTMLVVSFRTTGTSQWLQSGDKNYYILVFVILLLGFGGINLLANNRLRDIRYDFTEEKIYTLTETARKAVRNLAQPVTAKLYYTKLLEQKNPEMRQMFDRVRMMLEQLSRASEGRFSYRIYNPEILSDKEDQALAAGLQPLPIIGESRNAFFGLALTDELDNKAVIPFFAPERQGFLEQDIVERLFMLGRPKKTVGILSSLDMFDTMHGDRAVSQKWEIINRIGMFFEVKKIEKPEDAAKADVLMIVHPRNVPGEMWKAVEDFTLKGGKILVFGDAAVEAPRLYSSVNNDLEPSDFGRLEKLWGVQFHTEALAADLANSILVDVTNDYSTNPMFTQDVLQFVLKRDNLNREEPETRMLQTVMMASATVLEPMKSAVDRITFVPLMTTSGESQLVPAVAAQRNFSPAIVLRYFKADGKPKTVAAKIISKDPGHPYTVIAVGDADMLYDAFWARHKMVMDRDYVIPLLNNADFVLNALESLSGGETLAGLRGKSAVDRPFDNVVQMRKTNEQKFKIKEAQIFKKIDAAKESMQEIWSKRSFEGRENFTADELAVIAQVRQNLENLKNELGQIREDINRNIDRTDAVVKFVNIGAVPLGLVLVLGVVLFIKRRKIRKKGKTGLRLNRQAAVLALVCGGLLGLGILSVYLESVTDMSRYEDKLLFPKLAEEINEVSQIVLKSHDAELKLYKEDGVWKTENPAGLPVYQERVRSFLSALLGARFYEKKAANAEYLERFGLNPTEDENSRNIRIELKRADGKRAAALEVGKYDIDIGRGARAAYVKFDNQFQVWLAAVDFVDIRPDWQAWTYASLWNLRYGRLSGYDNVREEDRTAMLVKEMLNTYIESGSDALPDGAAEDMKLRLHGENNAEVVLSFYRAGDEVWIAYEVVNTGENQHLQLLKKYAANRFYRIKSSDEEKIKNVLKRRKE